MITQNWLIREDDMSGVTRITLSSPPVNALTVDNLALLTNLVAVLEADSAVRAVVLASALPVFSAGLNLKDAVHFDLQAQTAVVDGMDQAFGALFSFRKPLIAAVSGAAIAGGLFPVLCADYRIATAKAKFGLAEVKVGVAMPFCPMEIARAALSPNDLRRLMQRGAAISADKALGSGLIDERVEPSELLSHAHSVAAEYAQLPPQTYAEIKMQVRAEAIERIEKNRAHRQATPALPWFSPETRPAMRKLIG